jgi:hypothetical protein
MELPEEYRQKTIVDTLADHPQLAVILKKYRIDCASCGSTSCLFGNVIATHTYDPKQAARLEAEITDYFTSLPA